MTKRDFSGESWVNFVLRLLRAGRIRARGRFLWSVGCFAPGSSNQISFGRGLKMINSKSIRLGRRTSFGDFARIECHRSPDGTSTGTITVGDNTTFGDFAHIGSAVGVDIGSDVLGGSKILIVDHSHGAPKKDMASKNEIAPRYRPLTSRGGIVIEDHVWIGEGATILQGVRLGKGCIIPAHSIVKSDVAPYTIFNDHRSF